MKTPIANPGDRRLPRAPKSPRSLSPVKELFRFAGLLSSGKIASSLEFFLKSELLKSAILFVRSARLQAENVLFTLRREAARRTMVAGDGACVSPR